MFKDYGLYFLGQLLGDEKVEDVLILKNWEFENLKFSVIMRNFELIIQEECQNLKEQVQRLEFEK